MLNRREVLQGMLGFGGLALLEATVLSLLTGCGGSSTPANQSGTKEGDQPWHPGKLEREVVFEGKGLENEDVSIWFGLFTKRKLDINEESLSKALDLFADRGGVLPPKSTIILTEKDLPVNREHPEIIAQTNSRLDLILISLGRIFAHPELFIPKSLAGVYRLEDIANGALIGEICNLMITESGRFFTLDISVTRENIQLLCDSAAIMAVAIRAGRTYEQYQQEAGTKFSYGGEAGQIGESGKVLVYDLSTYQSFEQALEKPILEFK